MRKTQCSSITVAYRRRASRTPLPSSSPCALKITAATSAQNGHNVPDEYYEVTRAAKPMMDRTPHERQQFSFALWEMTRLYSFMHCEVIVDPLVDPRIEISGSLQPDGSTWKAVGTSPPDNGTFLGEIAGSKTIDETFSTAVFTDEELASFKEEPRIDHYIKAGEMYFRPNRGAWGFINWTLYPDRGCSRHATSHPS